MMKRSTFIAFALVVVAVAAAPADNDPAIASMNPAWTCDGLKTGGNCGDHPFIKYLCPVSCPSDPVLEDAAYAADNDALINTGYANKGCTGQCQCSAGPSVMTLAGCAGKFHEVICPVSCAALRPVRDDVMAELKGGDLVSEDTCAALKAKGGGCAEHAFVKYLCQTCQEEADWPGYGAYLKDNDAMLKSGGFGETCAAAMNEQMCASLGPQAICPETCKAVNARKACCSGDNADLTKDGLTAACYNGIPGNWWPPFGNAENPGACDAANSGPETVKACKAKVFEKAECKATCDTLTCPADTHVAKDGAASIACAAAACTAADNGTCCDAKTTNDDLSSAPAQQHLSAATALAAVAGVAAAVGV